MAKPAFTVNNFDLIRLFAAAQVALHHGLSHLVPDLDASPVAIVLSCIPGVPIFFFVSGFLVSRSFESSGSTGEYARNRLLRLYPGLASCVLLSLAMVAVLGYFRTVSVSVNEVLLWLAAQLSVVQFYNPDFLRGFGTGVINGSLWTIAVELQFYVLVPLLYRAIETLGERSRNVALILLILFFAGFNRIFFLLGPEHGEELIYKLVKVSFAPWFYMFLVGVIVQRNLPAVLRILEGRFLPALAIYALVMAVLAGTTNARLGNEMSPIPYLLLTGVIVAAAFSRRELAEAALHRNDISYGLYIWHMPVINAFLYVGWSGQGWMVAVAVAISTLVATASWFWVERPALRLKRRTLVRV